MLHHQEITPATQMIESNLAKMSLDVDAIQQRHCCQRMSLPLEIEKQGKKVAYSHVRNRP